MFFFLVSLRISVFCCLMIFPLTSFQPRSSFQFRSNFVSNSAINLFVHSNRTCFFFGHDEMMWWPVKLSFSKKQKIFENSVFFCLDFVKRARKVVDTFDTFVSRVSHNLEMFSILSFLRLTSSPFKKEEEEEETGYYYYISMHARHGKSELNIKFVNRQIWQEENKKPVGDILKQTNKKKKKNGVLFYFKFFCLFRIKHNTHTPFPSATNKDTI